MRVKQNHLGQRVDRIQRSALIVGIIALVLAIVGAVLDRQRFFQAYLMAYLFTVGLALGSLALLMLHFLTGGDWGFTIRRVLEAGSQTIPLMAVLFVPLLFGLQELYLWTDPEFMASEEALQAKQPYLNIPFFIVRTAIYFAIWIGLTIVLQRWSARQYPDGELEGARPYLTRREQLLNAFGLILYVLTMTFASVDWIMSLEPHWYSSIFGMLAIAGQALGALALAIAVLSLLVRFEPLVSVIGPRVFNDLGNLLLAFVLFWTYLAFTQFLVIWSGNLPVEVTWYEHRLAGGWQAVLLIVFLFHFVVPFAVLLSRDSKRNIQILSAVAALIVLMRLVDAYWMVVPAFHPGQLTLHWLDIVVPIALAGLWTALFIYYLKGRSLLPLRDPRLEEAFDHA